MKKPRILIFTPFRNEEHSIPLYLEALRTIDYPNDLIDVLWIENDSWDDTYRLLEEAKDSLDFNTVMFHSILIHGLVQKGPPGEYGKHVPQAPERVAKAWMSIWNDNLIPILKTSTAPYILVWFADAIPPSNVITEYLKVFKQHSDAGWVGGKCHRRFPLHAQLCSPFPREAADATTITPVRLTAHCWMNPREELTKAPMYYDSREMFFTVINGLNKQKLIVYYQPSVYLSHVSTDGKIYSLDDKRRAHLNSWERPPLDSSR